MADEVNMNDSITQERPWPFTITNANISKGAWLALSDPMTAATNAANGGVMAGIAAREVVSGDGKTAIGVHRRGFFPVTCSGTVTLGSPLGVYLNRVIEAGTTLSGAAIVGHALETGSNGELIMAWIDIGGGGAYNA